MKHDAGREEWTKEELEKIDMQTWWIQNTTSIDCILQDGEVEGDSNHRKWP